MNTEDFAIIIGVNYRGLLPLKATLSDATRFMEWVLSPNGGAVPEANVRILLSEKPVPVQLDSGRPIRGQIDAALSDFGVGSKPRVGRRLYFYFTGHGFGPDFDDVGMLMADASEDRLDRNIGLRPYRSRFFNEAPFDEVVFILDCCRDPEQTQTVGPSAPAANNGPARRIQDFIVLAAPYGEKAFEATDKATGDRSGFLTTAILEGLRDPRFADAQGRFTDKSLARHVRMRVPLLAAQATDKSKLEQVPNIDDPDYTDIVFSKVPVNELDTITVRIVAPKGLGGDLILYEGTTIEIASKPAAEVTKGKPPWEIDLIRNRWYSVRHTESPPDVPPAMLPRLSKIKENRYVFNFPDPN